MAKKAALSAGWAGSTNPDKNDNLTSKSQTVKVSKIQNKEGDRRRVTLRLTEDAWKQLKIMSIEEGCVAHKLLIEAVNDLFTKKGKSPIA
jgi:predicted DNA-binding antitoxin AbrB/MazE fold protein